MFKSQEMKQLCEKTDLSGLSVSFLLASLDEEQLRSAMAILNAGLRTWKLRKRLRLLPRSGTRPDGIGRGP